jgi:hypothetical protein
MNELSEIEKYEKRKQQINNCMKNKYHNDPETKQRRNQWSKEYLTKRYNNDEEFKEKMKKYQRDLYYKKKAKRLIEIDELKLKENLKIIEDNLQKLTTC